MSFQLPFAIVRFCLVGLMVAARLLCPCLDVTPAQAATPAKAHSCCDQTPGQNHSSKTDPADGKGCPHCVDSPQIKPTLAEDAMGWVAEVIDAYIPIDSIISVAARIDVPCESAALEVRPPGQLILLRSVVLLI